MDIYNMLYDYYYDYYYYFFFYKDLLNFGLFSTLT